MLLEKKQDGKSGQNERERKAVSSVPRQNLLIVIRNTIVFSVSFRPKDDNSELLRKHPRYRQICQRFSAGNRSSMQASVLQTDLSVL